MFFVRIYVTPKRVNVCHVGDAAEERTQPTTIVVAPFDDSHPDFMFMRMCHAQKAAVAAAGFGMSFVVLMFISAFFEFDWYHHKKGVDLIALLTLFFYLGFGVLIHYYVIVGVKRHSASYLLPFIVVYMVIIGCESVAALYPLVHVHTRSGLIPHEDGRNVLIFSLIMFIIIVSVQATMLAAVCKCRVYLSRKQIHTTAMKVAENSRVKNPGIQVLLAASANGAIPVEMTTSQSSAESNTGQSVARERSQDVEQINARMQFASNVQPPPYAASASSTYAYDQPPPTNDVPITAASSQSDTKSAVV
ncbi:unnamed protein product [Toxocara canis]|uniref:MARVEL domain-containing protein n=1 Tax=Toxocara canis TaxID=6265 RepID=A0A183UE72_TOXCA|nr:unnamed protein product [Toxocara canis]